MSIPGSLDPGSAVCGAKSDVRCIGKQFDVRGSDALRLWHYGFTVPFREEIEPPLDIEFCLFVVSNMMVVTFDRFTEVNEPREKYPAGSYNLSDKKQGTYEG